MLTKYGRDVSTIKKEGKKGKKLCYNKDGTNGR